MGHSDVPAGPHVCPGVVLHGGGAYALERVPSDNLTAQGVDACPSGTKHLQRLTGLDWRPPHSTLWSF